MAAGLVQSASPHAPGAQKLPSGWRMVRFGDVVQTVKVDVDPVKAGLERYIAGEHMDSDNLHITRWGNVGEGYLGPAFHRFFKKGQVLYGSRRTYLKKIAVADFDGVCANTTLVLETKGDELIPELLPFIMLSEPFTEHSVKNSKGSVNPYINWPDIARYTFPLPPKAEQRRIAEILWAADEAVALFADLHEKHVTCKYSLLNKLTTQGLNANALQMTKVGSIAGHWQLVPLGDVVSMCQYGLSIPLHESGAYPILRMMNYDDGVITADDLKYVDLDAKDFAAFRLQADDILFNRTNSADLVGKVGIFRLEGDYVFASYLVRLRADTDVVLPDYLNYYLNSDLGQRRMLAFATPGVSQTNISAGNLRKVPVPIPPIAEQAQIVAILRSVDVSKSQIRSEWKALQLIKTKLIKQFLELSHGAGE